MATSLLATTVDNQYFYEDEVFRFDKKGHVKFGLVLENSEAFSSDDDDFDDYLTKGEIRVAWHPYGREEVLDQKVVGLADRTLMPGDVVRRLIPGRETQRGYCREINMKADVKIVGSKFIVKHVDAERLKPLLKMPRDNAVCLDSWVGSTRCVNEKIVLMSSCGALIEVPDLDLSQLKDNNNKSRIGLFADTVFYPGQTVSGRLDSLDNVKYLTPSNLLKTNKKGKPIARKFVVQSVQIEGVWVHWQCRALSEGTDMNISNLQQPKPYITGDDLSRLKRLNLFESCMLQINDKNYLTINDCDVIIRKSQWEKDQALKYKLFLNEQKKEKSQNKQSNIKSTSNISAKENNKKVLNTAIDAEKGIKNLNKNLKMPSNYSSQTINKREKFETENDKIESIYMEKTDISNDCDTTDGWQTDDEEINEEPMSLTDSTSVTTISTPCSSPTPKSPKRSPLLCKKPVKKLKRNKITSEKMPEIGDEVVTEALVVYSTATVVWQDGSVEAGIPSTQLYPIHHLDDHEYFPGDFVLSGIENSNITYRDYGVIQNVDHRGRTAKVKWFTTYSSADEPKPVYNGETEVSVYDLKDHPDFQFRPGTIVIRVANFIGEDLCCTAGQIIDNYADGCVKVWWVDGHISMCWPQDLFEVGQYDSDNNYWDNENSDNDSWETESEISEPGEIENKEIHNRNFENKLERARIAMSRLEEVFSLNENPQNQAMMRQLLLLYKKCRFLDKLMGTTFFHEDHFMGLIARVRKGGSQTKCERAQDQKNRLFNQPPTIKTSNSENSTDNSLEKFDNQLETFSKSISNKSSTPYKNLIKQISSRTEKNENNQETIESILSKRKDFNKKTTESFSGITSKSSFNTTQTLSSRDSNITIPYDESGLITYTMNMIDMATEEREKFNKCNGIIFKKLNKNRTNDDSGNYSRNDFDGSSTSNDLTANLSSSIITDTTKSVSSCSIELTDDSPQIVCIKLCTLLKAQLVRALQEIQQKYCQTNSTLSEVIEYDEEDEEINAEGLNDNENINENDKSKESLEENDIMITNSIPVDCFQILETAPNSHKFHLTVFHPTNPQQYYKAIKREHLLLRTSLPPNVWVRVFEDRMDLLSVMIEGPKSTPYEDGMFFFDIQLGREYPKQPPLCHYISYCTDRLNPNLYEDGKVCVSLLGTWSGKESEVWSTDSTLLQVIVSIQGLILVSEPYFNEAGYEKQKDSQQGKENSRMYNEMVIIKLIQSMTKLLSSPSELFKEQIIKHFKEKGMKMHNRILGWSKYSLNENIIENDNEYEAPSFPLVPASRGFCLTLTGLLNTFERKLQEICFN